MQVKNRIKFAATGSGLCSQGKVSEAELAWLAERAIGGAGLITASGTAPHPSGLWSRVQLPNWDDSHVPELTKIAQTIKRHGARACLQIVHAGRYASVPEEPVGPSEVAPRLSRFRRARALTREEIRMLIEAHGEAVRRAREAGFDAAEIGAMAGYLIASFLSPWTNRRADEYGGSLENRARFLVECVRSAKEKAGADYPLIVRMCGDERIEGGNTPEDMRKIARLVEEAGADAISVTVGWHESKAPSLTMEIPPGHWLYLAEGMKKVLNIPVSMAFRLNSPSIAEQAIEEGKLDFWEMSRPLIADPDLPNKLAQGREQDIAPCIACMQGCYSRVFYDQPVRCLINARAGRESDGRYEIRPSPVKKRVVVIGGGPGGLEAARVAALRGHEVTLCEKRARLGGQLELAARTPHRGELRQVINYLSIQLRKLGVKVMLEREVTAALVRQFEPDVVIVATGSVPVIPEVSGMERIQVVTAHQVLGDEVKVGARVVVWGGRQVGVQTAELLATQSKEVTIIEEAPKIGRDITIFDVWSFRLRLFQLGVKMLTNTTLKEVTPAGITVVREGKEEAIPADTLVVAKKMESNRKLWQDLQGEVDTLYAVGDCVAPRKAINAIHEGFRVGTQI